MLGTPPRLKMSKWVMHPNFSKLFASRIPQHAGMGGNRRQRVCHSTIAVPHMRWHTIFCINTLAVGGESIVHHKATLSLRLETRLICMDPNFHLLHCSQDQDGSCGAATTPVTTVSFKCGLPHGKSCNSSDTRMQSLKLPQQSIGALVIVVSLEPLNSWQSPARLQCTGRSPLVSTQSAQPRRVGAVLNCDQATNRQLQCCACCCGLHILL